MYASPIFTLLFLTFISCVPGGPEKTNSGKQEIDSTIVETTKTTSTLGGRLSVDLVNYDFGLTVINTINSKIFEFKNTGTDSLLDCEEALLTGDDPDDFSIAINGCDVAKLSSTQSCDITIETNSKSTGLKKANLEWQCRDNKILIELKLNSQSTPSGCPDGYILVPGDDNLASEDFCVMKYEAKNDGKNNAISVAKYFPWVNIKASGELSAKSTCQDLGEGFDLISNQEWMTIARNIEKQAKNWDSEIVGSGHIRRGNAGSNDTYTYSFNKMDYGSNRDIKASHTLSNSNLIWDFSGNAYEYIDWGKETTYTPPPKINKSSCNPDIKWQELPLLLACAGITTNDYQSFAFSYDSSHGVGQVFLSNGGFAIRGGAWSSGTENSGIYNLNLSSNGLGNSLTGFRCVFRLNSL